MGAVYRASRGRVNGPRRGMSLAWFCSMNQCIRFDLYPSKLHPRTEMAKVRDLKVGDFIWVSCCSTPTFGLVGKIEHTPDGRAAILDMDDNGCSYSVDCQVERLILPISFHSPSEEG
jgi:hypothetical protein